MDYDTEQKTALRVHVQTETEIISSGIYNTIVINARHYGINSICVFLPTGESLSIGYEFLKYYQYTTSQPEYFHDLFVQPIQLAF